MKIGVIGTGGVGGYFGANLVRAGFDVTFLARGEHLKAIQNKGLKVKSILGDFEVKNLKATDKITDIKHPDLLLIGLKAWQVKDIRDELKSIMHADSLILPLQNGVLAAEELSEKIEKKNVLGGLCRIISKIESPGVINHFGVTPTIVFGELNKHRTERIIEVQKVFEKAGIDSVISDDIDADLWKKFISICVSGLLAVTKTTYGELRELKETRELMIDVITEVYLLSQKIGVRIGSDFVKKTVSFIDTYPYDSTSSLTRDVWEGKPSEIDYQNGTVVRLGEKYGIDTPINSFIYNSILPSELKARGVDLKTYRG
ncbi:MAG: 2-dehydropantoate 2-reductase [Bacteroidales bacterium]|jgi:2-dehydropantoate 2-reductase|nr:2-dehydropantoate 2-reductase [Bacteroidales bacterium]MDD4383541.1 2-dehydropantoate 2-reductase [Bacteroidales bacterium]MDY0197723.1 2-dehydropantoate 2-reductase [Tenuifilaceae bacterium]